MCVARAADERRNLVLFISFHPLSLDPFFAPSVPANLLVRLHLL